MCGILGIIDLLERKHNFNQAIFKTALDKMRLRGPDGEGIVNKKSWILGHRRLSIIDTNDHANQPMVSSCGKFYITFNGEIYNYKILRKKLILLGYKFKTFSDTEVLLYSYMHYGTDCLNKFIGMFSFCIIDTIKNIKFIARDRLGIKPLFIHYDKNKFIFSSQINSILELKPTLNKLNRRAVCSYLSFRYPLFEETFIKDIYSLKSGHYILINNEQITFKEYWNPIKHFKKQNIDHGENYYISKLRRLIKSSIKYRMISDVPIGSFLSGGVDSSIISFLMSSETKKTIKTFTASFNNKKFNEVNYINKLQKVFKFEKNEIKISHEDYLNNIEKLIDFKGSPLSVPNEIALFILCKNLKKYITVVLSGEGADEIFAGYGRIFRSIDDFEKINNIEKNNIDISIKNKFISKFKKKYSFIDTSFYDFFLNQYSYINIDDKKNIFTDEFDFHNIDIEIKKNFIDLFSPVKNESLFNKVSYFFEFIHLKGLLNRLDSSSMAASVESRVPFTDHRLVEFALSIPKKYKLKWKINKLPFHLLSDEISENYDIPKYILKKAFINDLPESVLYRRKMGFPVPLHDFFQKKSFINYAKKILDKKILIKNKIFNPDNISRLLKNVIESKNYNDSFILWTIVNLQIFITKYDLKI